MIWLYLIGGIQILGFGFTLTRLAYDEWQQWRASKDDVGGSGGPPLRSGVCNMENRDNVIAIGLGRASLNRPLWSFSYPHQVVSDANLDMDEKRAILSAWASDEHAVESFPTLRHLPGTPFPVTFSSIMDARIALDKVTAVNDDDPPPRPTVSRRPRSREPLGEAA
jgi:hypothetical protein